MRLIHAPPGEEFVLRDGTLLADIETLYRAIVTISDEEYNHFVTPEKNDFATWVERSLDDKFLAASLRRATTRDKMIKVLFMRLYM